VVVASAESATDWSAVVGGVVVVVVVAVVAGAVVDARVNGASATVVVDSVRPAAVTLSLSLFGTPTRPSATTGARQASAMTMIRRRNEGDRSPPSWRPDTPRL
jgi:hypothetical protein